ncbi:hypothetical protein PILCRDRAFT_562674 [Piloderma croceum F 1598]|uniref:Uncharacterized protein n=1 Tax=Piloderma croceum (strain F 1598) TaxID=765440 RepID=A0A0C3FHM1_PILCF|nr:hypothetical protein PILCRDRAFT_562674 [Piloderma croceum F 1598]
MSHDRPPSHNIWFDYGRLCLTLSLIQLDTLRSARKKVIRAQNPSETRFTGGQAHSARILPGPIHWSAARSSMPQCPASSTGICKPDPSKLSF